jgi:integrase
MPGERHRDFGNVRRLSGGRFQARYRGPDGFAYTARTADDRPLTFSTQRLAGEWLNRTHADIQAGRWVRPGVKASPIALRAYADAWLADRDLEQTTRDHYAQILRDHVYPTFGDAPVPSITPPDVRAWHVGMGRRTGPTARAHAYGLLRTILNTAVADELIAANPCRVRGGGQSKRVVRIKPASLAELETLVSAMPERYRVMVLLASWCGLRFGELAELRRSDIDAKAGVVHVRRGMVRTSSGQKVKGPKSDAGRRDVAIPPHLLPAVSDHLKHHAQVGAQGLLFPAGHGGHLVPSMLYGVFYPAREAAGRPDLRFHDLRHTGATLATATGATLAELMARLGHSTPGAAMRYQHASADRDRVIAEALSKLATDNVTPIRRTTTTRKRREDTA